MPFIIQQGLRFLCIVTGVILLSSIPSLLPSGGTYDFNWSAYLDSIGVVVHGLMNIQELTYDTGGTLRQLLPMLIDISIYSLTVLLGALLIALFVGACFTFVTMMLPRKWIKKVKMIFFILESLPDILIIFVCQLVAVWLYKKTGFSFIEVASLPGEPTYLLPMICLSIIPIIQYFKVMVSIVEDELERQYVQLAKSKGVVSRRILIVHILRNSLVSILNYTKTIIWLMLSNLFVLEYFFNINGIMSFLFNYMNPEIFALCILAIFIPLFLLLSFSQWLLEQFTNEKVVL